MHNDIDLIEDIPIEYSNEIRIKLNDCSLIFDGENYFIEYFDDQKDTILVSDISILELIISDVTELNFIHEVIENKELEDIYKEQYND